MAEPKIRVKLVGDDAHTAYISLPGHPEEAIPGVVQRTVCLDDLIKNFTGPRVHFDFDKDNRLIGIEVLVFGGDFDDDDESED
jgi:hypothetical protein